MRVSSKQRRAFSLLEVILALAILCGSLAALGEVARRGLEDAATARDLTIAQLLAESKMAEITAGITPAEPVSGASFESELGAERGGEGWVYSIAVDHTEEVGLNIVRVVVQQDLPENLQPVAFTLDRWILDDGQELSSTEDATETESASVEGSDASE